MISKISSLLHLHGLVKERLEFFLVSSLGPCGRWRSTVSTNVLEQPVISSHCSLGPGLDIGPGSHVLVFLLHPTQLGITILLWYLNMSVYWWLFAQQIFAASQNYCVTNIEPSDICKLYSVSLKICSLLPASWCQMGRDKFVPECE